MQHRIVPYNNYKQAEEGMDEWAAAGWEVFTVTTHGYFPSPFLIVVYRMAP